MVQPTEAGDHLAFGSFQLQRLGTQGDPHSLRRPRHDTLPLWCTATRTAKTIVTTRRSSRVACRDDAKL